ncbi:hypothetical protein BDR26DRAFT_916604 [Obelidium mucronatum]|nr:hypothetical protein BDR26DRAFT_916604 [Obelidium mucronatum]
MDSRTPSFLDLLAAPQPEQLTSFDDFQFYEYSNNLDDSFDHDDAQMMEQPQLFDLERNPNWIPADIELLMDQATNSLNIDKLSRQQILEPRDPIENEYEDGGDAAGGEEAGLSSGGRSEGPYGFDEMEMYGVPASQLKKKGKRGRKDKKEKPTDIDLLMGQVTHLYASKDYLQAFKVLHEVIRSDHKNAAAWKLLAVVHDELGDPAKALQANFIAAHLDPKDAGLWKRLAEVSNANGNLTDTLYCYSKAISADPTDTESWFERSIIYMDQNMLYKAIHGFTAILQVTPFDMKSIKELARIYIQLRESHKAIRLFESAIEADVKDPLPLYEEDEDFDESEQPPDSQKRRWRMGYEELLNLLELYIDVGEYDKGADAAEIVVGRLETGVSGDSLNPQHYVGSYRIADSIYENVPIEIRIKLGVCKLWLDDPNAAKLHFDALLELEVDDYSDLFVEVVDAYMKKRMFALAVGILEHVVKNEKMNVASIWAKMADCFQHLGRLEDAVELYKSAIEVDPREYDWQLQLAEIYEALGDPARAVEIVNQVNELTKEDVLETARKPRNHRRRASNNPTQQTQSQKQSQDSVGTVDESVAYGSDSDEYSEENGNGMQSESTQASNVQGFLKPRKSNRGIQEDRAVFLAAERLAISETKEWFNKMLSLEAKVGEVVKRADFVRFARKLVIRFQKERLFYPAERSRLYAPKGYHGDEDRSIMYQGLMFGQWFEIFVKCAMALTMDKRDEDAYLTLKTAYDANIFYHNETLRLQLKLYMLAAATVCGNYGRVVELTRTFFMEKVHDNDIYRFFCAVLNGGQDAASVFASDICAKHFARQLKQFEAHLANDPDSEIHKNPILLLLYGHILFSARSYSSALKFYLEAYKLSPRDPLINLSVGLAYLHWAMQRRIDNRHQRIIQAFTFLYQYEEIRESNPESMYNLGRAFHQLGLNNFAIEYYEKVLNVADVTGLVPIKEAAYNMALILHASNSAVLAQSVLDQYIRF